MEIPANIFFCYFGGRPFDVVNFVAIKSAVKVNNPQKVTIYYFNEPQSEWWNKAKEFCETVQVGPIDDIYGQPVYMEAHKADIWRLRTLISQGGIYLDLDVICNNPFVNLLTRDVVIGEECANGKVVGLNNAIILAKKGANFLQRWQEGYDPKKSLWKGFRSSGFDLYYIEMSIKYPYFLSKIWPDEVDIVPFEEMFGFSWSAEDLRSFFESDQQLPDSYVHHLWAGSSYERYLKNLSLPELQKGTSNFSQIMNKWLEDE